MNHDVVQPKLTPTHPPCAPLPVIGISPSRTETPAADGLDLIQGLDVVVVVVVSEGAAAPSLQLVVVCFSTIPGRDSVTVFLCTTAPLSQVVVLSLVAGIGVITGGGTLLSRTTVPLLHVVVVVCVPGAEITAGGVT